MPAVVGEKKLGYYYSDYRFMNFFLLCKFEYKGLPFDLCLIAIFSFSLLKEW